MNPTLCIFDLDGTLIDSLADIASATNQVLQHHGFPTHPEEKYKFLVGDGVQVLFQRALPEPARNNPETVHACTLSFSEIYDRSWAQTTRPYDGIPEVLKELAERQITLTVLSNKPHPFTVACVDRFFPEIPWASVLGNSPDFPRKPDPAGVQRILDQVGASPKNCLYFGDTNTDMQTARAGNCTAVGVTWGFRPAEELTASGAEILIDQPSEILGLFTGN